MTSLVGSVLGGTKVGKKATEALKHKKSRKKLKPEAVIPDDEELRRASRKEAAKRFGSGGTGRMSTMLSER